MFSKFKKEVLDHYGKTLSDSAKYNLLKSVRIFNAKHKTHYWVQISRIGESYTYAFLAVRNGGENGTLIHVRSFRNYLKEVFKAEIEKLLGEFNISAIQAESKIAFKQLSLEFKQKNHD